MAEPTLCHPLFSNVSSCGLSSPVRKKSVLDTGYFSRVLWQVQRVLEYGWNPAQLHLLPLGIRELRGTDVGVPLPLPSIWPRLVAPCVGRMQRLSRGRSMWVACNGIFSPLDATDCLHAEAVGNTCARVQWYEFSSCKSGLCEIFASCVQCRTFACQMLYKLRQRENIVVHFCNEVMPLVERYLAYYSQGLPHQWRDAVADLDAYLGAHNLLGYTEWLPQLIQLRRVVMAAIQQYNRYRFAQFGVLSNMDQDVDANQTLMLVHLDLGLDHDKFLGEYMVYNARESTGLEEPPSPMSI